MIRAELARRVIHELATPGSHKLIMRTVNKQKIKRKYKASPVAELIPLASPGKSKPKIPISPLSGRKSITPDRSTQIDEEEPPSSTIAPDAKTPDEKLRELAIEMEIVDEVQKAPEIIKQDDKTKDIGLPGEKPKEPVSPEIPSKSRVEIGPPSIVIHKTKDEDDKKSSSPRQLEDLKEGMPSKKPVHDIPKEKISPQDIQLGKGKVRPKEGLPPEIRIDIPEGSHLEDKKEKPLSLTPPVGKIEKVITPKAPSGAPAIYENDKDKAPKAPPKPPSIDKIETEKTLKPVKKSQTSESSLSLVVLGDKKIEIDKSAIIDKNNKGLAKKPRAVSPTPKVAPTDLLPTDRRDKISPKEPLISDRRDKIPPKKPTDVGLAPRTASKDSLVLGKKEKIRPKELIMTDKTETSPPKRILEKGPPKTPLKEPIKEPPREKVLPKEILAEKEKIPMIKPLADDKKENIPVKEPLKEPLKEKVPPKGIPIEIDKAPMIKPLTDDKKEKIERKEPLIGGKRDKAPPREQLPGDREEKIPTQEPQMSDKKTPATRTLKRKGSPDKTLQGRKFKTPTGEKSKKEEPRKEKKSKREDKPKVEQKETSSKPKDKIGETVSPIPKPGMSGKIVGKTEATDTKRKPIFQKKNIKGTGMDIRSLACNPYNLNLPSYCDRDCDRF